jgi:hypothetical protein
MDKHKILVDAKAELERHAWGTFVEGKATVALGGTGVIVSGCEACLMSCQVFCKGLSRLPAPRLRNSRDTLRPEFMFGLAISAHGSSDQNVFLGVATVADREDLSAFGIHDCQGASRFEMNGTFGFNHTQIVVP